MGNTVTKSGIEAKIVDQQYLVLPDGRSTLCILTLQNGFTIKGFSACVDINNFDIVMGRQIAYDDAFRQIWALEGYLLAEKLYWDRAAPVATNPPDGSWDLKQEFDKIIATHNVAATKKRQAKKAPYGVKKDGTPAKKRGRKSA